MNGEMPRPAGLELQPPEAVPVSQCLSLLCDGDRVGPEPAGDRPQAGQG